MQASCGTGMEEETFECRCCCLVVADRECLAAFLAAFFAFAFFAVCVQASPTHEYYTCGVMGGVHGDMKPGECSDMRDFRAGGSSARQAQRPLAPSAQATAGRCPGPARCAWRRSRWRAPERGTVTALMAVDRAEATRAVTARRGADVCTFSLAFERIAGSLVS